MHPAKQPNKRALPYLALGAATGIFLAAIPKLGGWLVLVSIWWAGAIWLPLLAVPSAIYMRRQSLMRQQVMFAGSAALTFTPIFFALVYGNETERIGLALLGAWVSAWFAAAVSPFVRWLVTSAKSPVAG